MVERLWHNIRESLWTLRVQRQRGTQRERYKEAVLHSFNTCFAMAPLSVLRTLWGWAVVGHLTSYWQGKVPGMALSWMLSFSLLVRHSRVCHQGTGKPMRQNNFAHWIPGLLVLELGWGHLQLFHTPPTWQWWGDRCVSSPDLPTVWFECLS